MPSLTLEALKKQIAARKPGPLHLFVGQDVQLMNRLVDAMETVVDEADRPFAVQRLYAGEAGASAIEIADAARVMPMLGDRRVVIVMRAERLLKPKRAGKAAEEPDDDEKGEEEGSALDTAPLESYVDDPASFATLVFVASSIDKGRRLTKRLIEKSLITLFDGNENDTPGADARVNLANVLRGTLARDGRSIDTDASKMLLSRAASNVTKLRDDLERLILFVGDRKRITSDDVMEVSSDLNAVEDDWAVVNAIAAGNAALALAETGRRFDRGDSAHALVGQLRWWVSAKLAPAEPGRVKTALDALLRTDLALKSSGGDDRVLVERLVVELTGRPVASQRGWR